MLPSTRTYEEARRAFRWHIPDVFNAASDALDRQCRPGADPDRTALIATLADGSTSHFSYGEIKRLSDLLASAFATFMVEPGTRVATLLPQGLEVALTTLATLKIGGVIAPMDPQWSPQDLVNALRLAAPRVLVVAPRHLRVALTAASVCRPRPTILCPTPEDSEALDFWATVYSAPTSPVRAQTHGNDPAFLIFSQGRTGQPRALLHAHRAVLGHVPALGMVFDEAPRPGDMMWSAAHPAHPAGLLSGLLAPWMLGIPILAMEAPTDAVSAEACFASFAHHGIRLALLTPQSILAMQKFPDPRSHYGFSLRAIACQGGRPPEIAEVWSQETFGLPLGRIYGEAETGPIAATHPHWYHDDAPNTLGRAIPGVRLNVMDADGMCPPLGGIGLLAVSNDYPGLCLSHEGLPAQISAWARRKYIGGWFLCDDLATIDEDGNLRFISRQDELIPCGDSVLQPEPIEDILRRHRMVADAAVTVINVGTNNEELVAILVAEAGLPSGDAAAEALLASDVLETAKRNLAAFAIPSRYVFRKAIPHTDEGRVQRWKLAAIVSKPDT